MKFDDSNKVIIETLNPDEAKAFIKFLDSECLRHANDIEQARDLMDKVAQRFDIELLAYKEKEVDRMTAELDYQEMWNKLELEITGLKQEHVAAIHPDVVLGYMHFIERMEGLSQSLREARYDNNHS